MRTSISAIRKTLFFLVFSGSLCLLTSAQTLQQAEKTFDTKNFVSARMQASAIREQEGEWTADALSIYLPSEKALYEAGNTKLPFTYQKFSALISLCDSFTALADKKISRKKVNYVADAKDFFVKMQQLCEYQNNRTLPSAIHFLNEAAMLYPNKNAGGYAHNGEVEFNEAHCAGKEQHVQLFFALNEDSSFLLITGRNSCDKGEDFEFKKRRFDLYRFGDAIDLKNVPDSTTKELVYCRLSRSNVSQRKDSFALGTATAFDYQKSIISDGKTGIQNCVVTNVPVKSILGSVPQNEVVFRAIYPIIWWFDEANEKFKNEHYPERIEETFRYIISYYRK